MRSYNIYKNTEDSWGAMLGAIKAARVSIYWEIYILKNDTNPFYDFFGVLMEKARSGVKVRIVLDGFANYWYSLVSDELVAEARKAGVEILFFNSWYHRIHRKILIIDEAEAFLGGVNVAKSYRKWLDLHIRIKDKTIVNNLLSSFAKTYFYSGGKSPYLLSIRKRSHVRRAELWLLEHFPNMGKLLLRRYYTEKIAQAEKSIIMVTPYFIPKRWLILSLKRAVARGVRVEVILPGVGDNFISNFTNHLFVSALSDMGIHFYMMPQMIHAKAFLVDDKVGLIGSNNIDTQSFEFNIETSISFERRDMVSDLKKIVEEWKEVASPFDGTKHAHKWYLKPIEFVVGKIAQKFL